MYPGVMLGIEHIPPAAEGMSECGDTGKDERLDGHEYKKTWCDALSLLTNLGVTQTESFQDFCLRFPHTGLFRCFGVIVAQQM